MISPERLQELAPIVERVLDAPPEQRTQLISSLSQGDPGLEADLRTLLKAHAAPGPLDHSIDHGSPVTEKRDPPSPAPTNVGPYRILREIGKGGMGTVYLAERADGQFTQQVAVKVRQSHVQTAELSRRFVQERQILASLSHPNIAQLIDGGVLPDGTPYFVMEYVEGQTITEYCQQQQLSINQRLELFQTIAHAVSYAHRQLVVHRDIKPSNILVSTNGHVKLLDFGIAKIVLDAEHASEATGGLLALTPEYASPEQLTGEPTGVGTDVYQLGLVLFELLTDRRPFQLENPSPASITRAIVDTPAPRPSSVVKPVPGSTTTCQMSSVALQKRLSGDLDAIVTKSLAKNPEERYHSVESLLQDLTASHRGHPITAKKSDAWDRGKRFVKRHLAMVSAATIAVIAVIFALGLTLNQSRRVAVQRDRALQVVDLLQSVFDAADPYSPASEGATSRVVLDNTVARIEREFSDDAPLQSEMLLRIAALYRNLGVDDEAIRLSRHAINLREGNALPKAQAQATLASVFVGLNQPDSAESLLAESLPILEREGSIHDIAQALVSFSTILIVRDRLDSARAILHRVERILDAENIPTLRASQHANLGRIEQAFGNFDLARDYYRMAAAIREEIVGKTHPLYANDLVNLADILVRTGQPDSALVLLEAALQIRKASFGSEHRDVGITYYEMGEASSGMRDYVAADTLLQEAIRVLSHTVGARSVSVALAYNQLAIIHQEQFLFGEASDLYQISADIYTETLGPDHTRPAIVRSNLGWNLFTQGRHEEALDAFLESQRVLRISQIDTALLAFAVMGQSAALGGLERHAEAEVAGREALQLLDGRVPETHWQVTHSRRYLALSLGRRRINMDEAIGLLEKNIAAFEQRDELGSFLGQSDLTSLALFYRMVGQADREAQLRSQLTPRWRTHLDTVTAPP